jgi:hypothetical protein
MINRMNRGSLFVKSYLAVLVITVVGCTQETSHGIVNGTVTLDGAPLAEGLIRFDVIEELLPARYNVESELILTVSAGKQPASFNLQTEQ